MTRRIHKRQRITTHRNQNSTNTRFNGTTITRKQKWEKKQVYRQTI